MSKEILEALRDKIFLRLPGGSAPIVVWHAGEPTSAPIEWYNYAYSRLLDVVPAKTSFAMQSNGILINEKWINLFRRTNTNVSLSIDGPQKFHDARRRTRNGRPTWELGLNALKRLQKAGFDPSVITVLHPEGLTSSREYYEFYRDNGITQISLSIDELEGANKISSFSNSDFKPLITAFLVELLERAYSDEFPLHIREVERVAQRLTGIKLSENEQVLPWAAICVTADGNVSTFSPELMEADAPAYNNFVFGNILDGDLENFGQNPTFLRTSIEVAQGVQACGDSCKYFAVCGGGSPVNKLSEKGSMNVTETDFCRLTTQASTDALLGFLKKKGDSRS
jgi:uncharacterized protein